MLLFFFVVKGTGTPIGDPIESNALSQFFRGTDSMDSTDTLYIGSVKTNIGHTEAAAGVAGLIKVLLMMKNEQIVPSLMYHKSNENPKIQFHKHGKDYGGSIYYKDVQRNYF